MIFFNLFQIHFINSVYIPLALELRYTELSDNHRSQICKTGDQQIKFIDWVFLKFENQFTKVLSG